MLPAGTRLRQASIGNSLGTQDSAWFELYTHPSFNNADAQRRVQGDTSPSSGSTSLSNFPAQGRSQPHSMQDTHSTWYRHKSETTVLLTPDTQKQGEGIVNERQMASASSQGHKKSHPRAPPWDDSTFEGSPLLFQWGCSPLQVLWKPSAGGRRPAGSSTVQDWAQPMVRRWEQGGGPEMALLVGARGTRKGRGDTK